MKYSVDVVRIRENAIQLNGWAIGKTPESKITYEVEDGDHRPLDFKYVSTRRDDVSQIYFKKTVDQDLGFDIQFPYERGRDYYLVISGDGRKVRVRYNEELIAKRSSVAHKRRQKILDLMNMETVHVAWDFFKENGLKALIVKSKHKLQGIDSDYDYSEWQELTKPSAEELEAQRKAREEAQERLRSEIYTKLPRVAAIDRELRRTITQIIAASLRDGSDPVPAIGVIRDKNLSLQAEKAALLTEHGYPADALDDKPACPKCSDTGWVGANMCACLKALCTEEQIRELSKLLDLGEQSFDSFSLDYYSPLPWPGESLSPRENMEFIFDVCSSYARKFGRFYFRNLFLTGAPGLGKTFLSACIARTVSESGFSVVYDTAVNIFTRFEEQKFARDRLEAGEAKDETRRYLGCDLLILDDLGSELSTPFVQSALYTLINTRLTADKRTVISSNLTMDQVRARYTPQIASRLEGEYRVLPFYGEDIRLLRKQTL